MSRRGKQIIVQRNLLLCAAEHRVKSYYGKKKFRSTSPGLETYANFWRGKESPSGSWNKFLAEVKWPGGSNILVGVSKRESGELKESPDAVRSPHFLPRRTCRPEME